MSSKIEFLKKFCIKWVRSALLSGAKPDSFDWSRALWNRGWINHLFRKLPTETYGQRSANQYLGEDIELSYDNWERAVVHLQRLEAVLNDQALVIADPGVNTFGERTTQHFVWTIEDNQDNRQLASESLIREALENKTVSLGNYSGMRFQVTRYRGGGVLINLLRANGSVLYHLTTSLPEKESLLREGEFFPKLWSENEPLKQLLDMGWFKATGMHDGDVVWSIVTAQDKEE